MTARAKLLSVLGDETDDEVVTFILGAVDPFDTDDDPVDTLADLLAAHQLTDSTEETLRGVAAEVVALVAAGDAPAAAATPPVVEEATLPPGAGRGRGRGRGGRGLGSPAEPLKAQATAVARPPGLPAQPSRPPPSAESQPERGSTSSEPASASIAALREVMPDASPSVCQLVLHRCAGSIDEAVEMLLTTPLADLEAEIADRVAADAAAEAQDAKAAKAARKRTVSRNALVAENADGSPIKVEPPRLPYAASRKEAIRGPSTRYREGQVSSTKGGKFLVEEKEDWDGGSRGRVNTKGKRGPGFAISN
tara:strand:+ start:81 stop:1004 length:924 start_codon:yes stop_codon:yes gene_type:complete